MFFSKLTTATSFLFALTGCASYQQTQNDVYQRKSGGTLQPWLSVKLASEQQWQYAWAAWAAYQHADDPSNSPLENSEACPEPHEFLSKQGWVLWTSLPLLKANPDGASSRVSDVMHNAHLRAEVWENREQKTVIVTFGGTVFSNLQDWKANLHWFLSPFGSYDQYDVVSDVFVPAFVEAYQQRSKSSDHAWLLEAAIVPVGHSLGGGLAQRFAYSLPPDSGIPRVKNIYAFDPSPVSGKRGTRYYVENGKGLTIYRIYNRGEILASLRSLLHWSNPTDANEQGQTWLDIRYLDDWSFSTLSIPGSVRAHSISSLACFMKMNLDETEMQQARESPADSIQ